MSAFSSGFIDILYKKSLVSRFFGDRRFINDEGVVGTLAGVCSIITDRYFAAA